MGDNNLNYGIASAYSIPRLITPAVQCSFCAYMWELYTKEFGWSMSEWEVVSRTCTGTQILSFIGLGYLFNELINKQGNDTKKKEIQDYRLKPTKYILAGGTFLHWITYFFLIYLPIKWHGVKIFGNSLSTTPKHTLKPATKILPVLATLRDPTCSACCNTTCCNNFAMRMNHFGRWFGTRTFFLYLLAVGHGIGVSVHELSNRALEGYIYPEKDASSGNTDDNELKRAKLVNYNLTFFFGAQLIIITIFSLLKFFVRSRAFFAETFFIISIMFVPLQIIILSIFGYVTDVAETTDWQALAGSGGNKLELKVFCLTIWHGTILFWMFSGGPLTFYISMFILGGDTGIMGFGVLITNGALTAASLIFIVITLGDTGINPFDGDKPKTVTSICIPLQFLIFMMLFRHGWRWNKGNWFNYVLIIVTGMLSSVFVTYTNVILGGVLKSSGAKGWKWAGFGFFFSGTNVIVSGGFFFILRAFGRNEPWISVACKCIQFNIRYSFPVVYGGITILFIFANAGAAAIYWLVAGG